MRGAAPEGGKHMPISFSCATCGKPYVVDDRFAGKKAACRMCGNVNLIPSAE